MDAWLARAAREHGSGVALSSPLGPRFTYAQLHTAALAVAGGLRARGVRRGDRVALPLPSEDLVVALHACLLIGAAAIPIDLRLAAQERDRRAEGARLVLPSLDAVAGAPVEPDPTRLDEVATVMFTSGTTAGPKEVRLTLDNWLGNAVGSALALGLDRRERWLCPMPLAHVGGLSIPLRSVVYATEVLLHGRYDTGAVLDVLSDPSAGVTLVSLVPTMLARLLDAGLREPPTLRWALLGGGPIAPALLDRAEQAGVPVAPSYGMTEAGSQIATFGRPLFGTEVTIADNGEVLVRGRTVAAGALAADGWLHTGDLGRLDAQGRLAIVGRVADTIVSGGENVAPAEVEAVLSAHPSVADVAVLGRSDPEWGETVIAQLVPAAGQTLPGDEALRAFCARRLAGFKIPKRFERVDTLPRSVTGKLLRRELR